jgi:hypothetical protein
VWISIGADLLVDGSFVTTVIQGARLVARNVAAGKSLGDRERAVK